MPERRVLLVYPRFTANNLLSFEYMTGFYPKKRAVMPPLGLLIIGQLLKQAGFLVRLVDENVHALEQRDVEWADVVATSGMHPQRVRIEQIVAQANAAGKVTVVGGPSVSICPEYYGTADFLHLGEVGDATMDLLAHLKEHAGKPPAQRVFATQEKTPLDEQPAPDLGLVDPNVYLTMPVQFSVGCPYTCEFCDIPAIYGRVARVKSPARVVGELEAIYDAGFVGSILFVDDNLIAQRKALRRLLPEIVEWQKQRGYPYPLTGEASLDIHREDEILAAMQEARFSHIFIGIESPDPATLVAIAKKQNIMAPQREAVDKVESYGIEVIYGMILGFDTDDEQSGARMAAFIRDTRAPIVYFNLLSALPKTPLWDRLTAEKRLVADESGDVRSSETLLSCLNTNVRTRLPADVVKAMLLQTVRDVYAPEEVYARFTWNAEHVYTKQKDGIPPARTRAEQWYLVQSAFVPLARCVWGIGIRSAYRRHFWRFAKRLVELRIEGRLSQPLYYLLKVTPNAHHLIVWGEKLEASAVEVDAPEARRARRPTSGLIPLRSRGGEPTAGPANARATR